MKSARLFHQNYWFSILTPNSNEHPHLNDNAGLSGFFDVLMNVISTTHGPIFCYWWKCMLVYSLLGRFFFHFLKQNVQQNQGKMKKNGETQYFWLDLHRIRHSAKILPECSVGNNALWQFIRWAYRRLEYLSLWSHQWNCPIHSLHPRKRSSPDILQNSGGWSRNPRVSLAACSQWSHKNMLYKVYEILWAVSESC